MVSYSTLERIGQDTRSWDQFGTDYTYLLLHENADPAIVEQKIPAVLKNHLESEKADNYQFALQPLKKIYFGSLGSHYQRQLSPKGEISVILGLGLVAAFILIQAVANFVNLSTAKSAERMKEVGVRKVFGAFKSHLIPQFLGESTLIAVISMAIGLTFYELSKSTFDHIFGREATADFYSNPLMLISIIGLIALVGVLAGFYPALYLSRYRPITILQGKIRISSSRSWLRRILVVFQFGLAVFFIVCTITIYRQLNYVTGMNLGFDSANMLLMDFEGEKANEDCQLMRNEILRNHEVLAVTSTNCPPGRKTHTFYGFYTKPERRKEDMVVSRLFKADYDFLSTFGLKIVEGREFSRDVPTDVGNAVLLTERGVQSLGIENPIGYKFYRKDGFREVIGVVKDFHGSTLNWGYQDVSVIMLQPEECNTLVVKLPPDNMSASIAAIGATWEKTLPGIDFRYSFLDEEISNNYNEMRGQTKVFFGLAFLTIVVACLGIFGLVAYTAEQKTREIGIRKVLGGTVTGIITLLSKEFIILIGIANIIAWPVAYLLMQGFLQEFPFRIGMGIGTFLLAAVIVICFALFTSGFQAYKAAVADPVKSLRYE